MASEHDIERNVNACVEYCSHRKKWFLYVIAYAHRLVRHHLLSEVDAAEVTYRARKVLRGHEGST